MNTLEQFRKDITEYSVNFCRLSAQYDHTIDHVVEMETVIDAYSKFITDARNKDVWEQMELAKSDGFNRIVEDVRNSSAQCVAIMEKYRAMKLLNGDADKADYFNNIESCIEKEFGSFRITSDSQVIMIGSGSFPMTPILIAKRTGARVVGIDIDEEAIHLGRQIVERLGDGLRIQLEKVFVEHLDMTKDATHIIFSSTVANKYDLLDQLHALTNEQVVVAMRYGDKLKSLFNYPMKQVDESKWRLVETVLRPDHVFDVALYEKTPVASR